MSDYFIPMQLAPTRSTLSNYEVLIYPREPSEIVLQVENMGTRTLRLNVQLDGSFPQAWCHIGMEGRELAPRSRMDIVLYFQVPDDFFENQMVLKSGQSLVLDYHSSVQVSYIEEGTNKQFLETAAINLHVRPRSLYLDLLPVVYSEVDFIGRLLKVFEQAFEPAVQTLDTLWAYFDPRTAPVAMLPFLAHWVALPLSPQWSIEQQRYLIHNAIELYRWRGTKEGLRLYIHLYTGLPLDEHICIEEVASQGLLLGATRLGQDSMIGNGRPYHFIVRLRCDQQEYREYRIDEQLVRQIIDQEKPAFCTYELYIN